MCNGIDVYVSNIAPRQQDIYKEAMAWMDNIRDQPGNRIQQETQMRLLTALLCRGGIPIVEFLDTYYRQLHTPKCTTPPPPIIASTADAKPDLRTCRGCGKQFSQKAFNGHGESRCLIKHGKEAAK